MNGSTNPNNTLSRGQRRRLNRRIRREQQTNAERQIVVVREPSSAPRNPQRGSRNQQRPKAGGRRRGGPNRGGSGSVATYLDTLKNPEISGVKVPDLVAFPTTTFQVVAEGTCGTGVTAGDSVMVFMQPRLGASGFSYPIYTCKGTTAGSVSDQTGISWPNTTAINASFGYARPVSASLELSFIGSSTQDSGYLSAGIIQRNGAIPTTASGVLNLPNNVSCDLHEGAKVLWKPQDNADLEFAGQGAIYPVVYVLATGLNQANTTLFRYRVVCNFESIPTNDTAGLFNAAASPISLDQLQRAFSWGQQAYNNVAQLVGPSVRQAGIAFGQRYVQRLAQNAMNNMLM